MAIVEFNQEGDMSDVGYSSKDEAHGPLPEMARSYLKLTAPWAFFVGIMACVCLGLMTAAGLLLIFLPAAERFILPNSSTELGRWVGVWYIVIAALYVFPARHILAYGKKLREYVRTGEEAILSRAFKDGTSFWKFIGVLMIVMLSLVVLVFVIAIVAVVAVGGGALAS
jgi:hypothetical protein